MMGSRGEWCSTFSIGDYSSPSIQTAVLQVLKTEPIDPHKVVLCGGSHGGFLSCHLIGQYPEFYKSCIVRNPVVNIPAMAGSTDIPDWWEWPLVSRPWHRNNCKWSPASLPSRCLVESGLTFSYEALPEAKQWGDMLNKSPIIYVSKVPDEFYGLN